MKINNAEISRIIVPEQAHVATSPLGTSYLQRDGYLTTSNLFQTRDLRSLETEIGGIRPHLLQAGVLRELGEASDLT